MFNLKDESSYGANTDYELAFETNSREEGEFFSTIAFNTLQLENDQRKIKVVE